MGIFSRNRKTERFGAIIEIGSGSVLVAIVHSEAGESSPYIVWSHREQAPVKNIESLEQSSKAVLTALVNASMMLDAHGRQALVSYRKGAHLTHMQCSIAAPWSYTITKTISYKQKQAFTITRELIDELVTAAQQKITTELEQLEATEARDLTIIDQVPMDIVANGYHVPYPEGETASTLNLSHANVITHQTILNALTEMHDKLLSRTKKSQTSFAVALQAIHRQLYPHQFDTCFVDITNEATELGIMRNGVLTYCTHIPYGTISLAREIAAATNTPLAEAVGQLHDHTPADVIAQAPEAKQGDITAIFEAYQRRMAELFHHTGDALSIPKQITLHVDSSLEPLFNACLKNAGKQALKTEPTIQPITSEIIKQLQKSETKNERRSATNDTALLVSAQFFHTENAE